MPICQPFCLPLQANKNKEEMNFLKALFGGSEVIPEEEKQSNDERQFDLMKYDGVKAMKIGRFDYAQRCFEEALKLRDDLEVRDYLSRVLIRLDRLDDALAELQRLADAQPQNVAVLQTMAHVAYMQEDYQRMAAICEQALTVDETSSTTYLLFAQSALGQGDPVNSIARLTKAITLDEQNADARLMRGQILLRLGDVSGAGEDAQWLVDHVADHEDVLLLAARVAHAKGEDDTAITLYNKVVDMNPFALEAYQERGKICFDRGDKQQAEADMRKVLELNPQQLADVSGDYSAEGVEQQMKRAYSMMNPFGI